MAKRTTESGASAARERLLTTASDLFYREGIHAVGVDRIVSEAGVTRATFYRHFPSKEDLVEAYLDVEDSHIRSALDGAREVADGPAQLVEFAIAGLADDVERNHTRGCPFINAAAEYPEPDSGVRLVVARHRAWFRGALEQMLTDAGRPEPEVAAAQLVLLRDAAMVGGYLDGWERVRSAFLDAAGVAAGITSGGSAAP